MAAGLYDLRGVETAHERTGPVNMPRCVNYGYSTTVQCQKAVAPAYFTNTVTAYFSSAQLPWLLPFGFTIFALQSTSDHAYPSRRLTSRRRPFYDHTTHNGRSLMTSQENTYTVPALIRRRANVSETGPASNQR